jgi:hypothetical protein
MQFTCFNQEFVTDEELADGDLYGTGLPSPVVMIPKYVRSLMLPAPPLKLAAA